MTEPPGTPNPQRDSEAGAGVAPATRKSRWGLVLGIIIAIGLVGLMIILHLTGTLGPGTH